MADNAIMVLASSRNGLCERLADMAEVLADIRADIPDPTCPKIDRLLTEISEPRKLADKFSRKGSCDSRELEDFAGEVDSVLWSLPDSLEDLRSDNAQLRDSVYLLGSYCHDAADMLREALAEIARLTESPTS